MRLRELVVNRAPVAIAPGNAFGIEDVAIQIALSVFQGCLVLRTQVRAIETKQRFDIFIQHCFSDGFANLVKVPARCVSTSSGGFLLRLMSLRWKKYSREDHARNKREQQSRRCHFWRTA